MGMAAYAWPMTSWHWNYSLLLPRSGQGRSHIVHALNHYFIGLTIQAPGNMTVSLLESPRDPNILDIRLDWQNPPTAVSMSVFTTTTEWDVRHIVSSYVEPEPSKKSVWEWLVDKNPYD